MPNTDPEFTKVDGDGDVLVVVEYMGLRFKIYERSGTSRLWFRGTVNGERRRESTGCSELEAAKSFVVSLIEELNQRIISGEDLRRGSLTLKQVWGRFESEVLPTYDRRQFRTGMKHSVKRILDIWGVEKTVDDIDAHDVKAYVRQRTSEDDVKASTAKRDLTLLHLVLSWAEEKKIDGRSLIKENPLEWSWMPSDDESAKRPVTGHDRFLKVLPYTRNVATGSLHRGYCTTMWVLARYTGRRIGSIRQLRYCDLLLSPDRIRAMIRKLLNVGVIPDDVPDAYLEKPPRIWEHGAVRWPPEYDKNNLETWIVPLHPTARRALDNHLERHPGTGDEFIFRSRYHTATEGDPISESAVDKWFDRAENAARAQGVALRKRSEDGWHALRRGWKTDVPGHIERKVVAKVGGWKWQGERSKWGNDPLGVSRTMERYQRTLPLKEYRAATALPPTRPDVDTDSVTAETIEEMDPQELKGMLKECLL